MTAGKDAFPFSAVVGQDDARLALLLAAIDPAIGGVLLRGDKGSAKSTLARGLAGLLPDGAPFVELPIGATEDRVLGSLDLRAALVDGADRFRPGLLAAAHGGVLYVDEVNLLPDHLVDGLLDAAASGINRVERDGVSHEHPARFVLLGSMNPEEGELRPQLLDRFGLSVEVRTPLDPALRAEAVRRRLAHDAGNPTGEGVDATDTELRRRLAEARPAGLPDEVIAFAARLAVEVGAESLRADLVLCRAAAALAGWEGRTETTSDDVVRVAPLALGHRRRRRPFDPPTLPPDELADALDRAAGSGPATADSGPEHSGDGEPDRRGGDPGEGDLPTPGGRPPPSGRDDPRRSWQELAGDALSATPPLGAALGARPPGPVATTGPGRTVRDRRPPGDEPQGLAVLPTVRAALQRRALDPTGATLTPEDVREPQRVRRQGRTVVLVLDTSGSMGTVARVTAATGAVLGLLADAYLGRDQVALVAFRNDRATEVLPPTASVELARACLADLPTGGPTPLAEGLTAGLKVAERARTTGSVPLLVLLSDGRATGRPGALDDAREVAEAVAQSETDTLVLDAEDGAGRESLGLARELAQILHARYVPLTELTADAVGQAITSFRP